MEQDSVDETMREWNKFVFCPVASALKQENLRTAYCATGRCTLKGLIGECHARR